MPQPFRRGGPGSISDAESSTKGGIRSEDEDDIEDEDDESDTNRFPPHGGPSRRSAPTGGNGQAGSARLVMVSGSSKASSSGWFP